MAYRAVSRVADETDHLVVAGFVAAFVGPVCVKLFVTGTDPVAVVDDVMDHIDLMDGGVCCALCCVPRKE